MKKPLKEKLKQIGGEHLLNEAFSKKKVDTKIIAKRMMKDKHYRMWFGPKWAQAIIKKYRNGVSEADIDRDMPEYVPGALISDLFDGLNEGKLNEKKETIFDVADRVMKDKQAYKYKSGRGQVMVDMQTANLLTKVWKKISSRMKKHLTDLGYKDPAQLVQTLWAIVK